MKGYGFLIFSLVVAAVGIGFYHLGPIFQRWHERLEAHLSRLKKNTTPQDTDDNA
jgi:hypothetical protein